ncbi:Mo-dependent nitrogenase C-terminal domain-containing protein [Planktothrix agardhii]|jgi:hypothetical protein|uniref:Mo-dependent nitrogenase C-terminal domain-containing protein n=2 Tax=Planktothrix agardhii TaxID=1160 RepID=A0A073CHI7_PLAA1|nr:Mo-dependent nitrogenase C-terminal domain-containing protein [Planktothrix agardhii]MCF3606643.1 Mo-dependent nitrogenase C-terminal domain-containing protein [Planktothrix agardhii 1033]BBD56623.1 hypothetical protein NIES204_39560 [Planktothrix agardhii NIES-204]KEI67596.1 hypothetical protein A19Y_2713 [Planktothrix agardhii NIVA-CYA 126/8]MBG0747983.1 Mo-dependent nitrogenase C-terminal domain-containing protein [Planktothrix agardhii KL2]MCB8750839.1 Mo-dependent nitrogenase C-termina
MRNLISSVFNPLRKWLDSVDIHNPDLALFVYRVIPAQCPFARDIKLFGHTILHIPPLCKFNPLYEELMGLRFRAMCYLVDDCGMTI